MAHLGFQTLPDLRRLQEAEEVAPARWPLEQLLLRERPGRSAGQCCLKTKIMRSLQRSLLFTMLDELNFCYHCSETLLFTIVKAFQIKSVGLRKS